MADVWFTKRDDQKAGPYTSGQLRQMVATGQLLPIDLVARGEADNWVPASNVKGLFTPPTPTQAPPPLPRADEWHYSQAGIQTGPVDFDTLKEVLLKPGDMVWKAGTPGWVAASSVPDLLPPLKVAPPPLPTPVVPPTQTSSTSSLMGTMVLMGGDASYAVVIEPYTGRKATSDSDKVDVTFDGRKLGSGSLRDGLRLPGVLRAPLGVHNVSIMPSAGVGSKLRGMFGKPSLSTLPDVSYRVEFLEPADYTIQFRFEEPRAELDYPVEAVVSKQGSAQGFDVMAKQGAALVGKGFSALARGWGNMQESSRRSQLHGRWEPTAAGQWFMFTRDNAMMRGDGFATKYRWADDETVELFEGGSEVVVPLKLLSLGKHEMILKAGDQSGHFRRTQTITEAVEQQQRQEAERRHAEWRDQTVKVLAIGGLAVLIGTVAVAATVVAASAPSHCTCMFPRGGPICSQCGHYR